MKRLTACSVLLFVIAACSGQTDFRQGYVITHQMDTLKGLIDYDEGRASFRSCAFKATKNGNIITYEPGDILGYGFINDKYFVSREIDLDGEQKMAFLEVIVKGLASLYRFENSYLVEKNSHGLHVLKNESQEGLVNDRKVKRKSNQHISTFNILFFDCVELRPRLQKFRLDERTLTGIVESYNSCQGEPGVTFKAAKQWVKTNVSIAAGVDLTGIKGSDASLYEHDLAVYKAVKSPIGVVLFDISSPRWNESISLHTGIFYQPIKYYGHDVAERTDGSTRLYVTLESHSVKIPAGVRYIFPERKFTPFLNAGISSTFFFQQNGGYIVERESNGSVNTSHNSLVMDDRRLGYWGGAGGIIKLPYRFDALVEFRYEGSTAALMTHSTTNITSVQFTIGIRTK